MSTVNLYDILNVSSDCTRRDLKRAYRKLVLEFHPDKPNGDEEMFELITHAYNVLSNEESRCEYDELYKLSKQIDNSHFDLKDQSNSHFKAQETSVIKRSKDELENDFKNAFSDLDKKHNYSRSDTSINKIAERDALGRLDDLKMTREQQDLDNIHDELFDSNRPINTAKFNEAWELMHKGPLELIKHEGNPDAWLGPDTGDVSYSSIDNYDNLYADDDDNYGIEGSTYGPVNFDQSSGKKLSKSDIGKLSGSDYTNNHNKKEDNYEDLIKKRLHDRELQSSMYANMDINDFDDDPTFGGYGITSDIRTSTESFLSLEDAEDIKKKYQRLLNREEK